EAFRQGMRELGYVEDQNLVIEGRWAEGKFERYPALAAELASSSVDVIVEPGHTPAALALKHATSTIPIVMTGIGDPVGAGLVASLPRPGSNVTGLSDLLVGLSGKRLELLKEAIPSASRVVAVWNPTNPASTLDWAATQEAARTLGVELRPVQVRSAADVEGAFEAIAREQADALIRLSDPLLSVNTTPQAADFIASSR